MNNRWRELAKLRRRIREWHSLRLPSPHARLNVGSLQTNKRELFLGMRARRGGARVRRQMKAIYGEPSLYHGTLLSHPGGPCILPDIWLHSVMQPYGKQLVLVISIWEAILMGSRARARSCFQTSSSSSGVVPAAGDTLDTLIEWK